jgi:alpha-beta hydrolase superfamily lysophospholipase
MHAERTWVPDVLDGFEQTTLTLPRAYDGDVEVVLVRRPHPAGTAVAGVLYVHGFVDHFFQTHLADFYEHHGLRCYAIDLRRHGRSMRPHQLPCDIHDIDELIADVDAAIDVLTAEEGIDWLLVNGHSTGGLVAALHAHRGARRDAVSALFLNSPFLDMNVPAWQERVLEPVLSALGRVAPGVCLPGLSTVYGESLHADHHGSWRYDTRWKPVEGFPTRAGWLRAIHRAQAEVARGLAIDVPVLVLHSSRSLRASTWTPEANRADTVLDVADMVRLAPRLGTDVVCREVPDGMHDLVLSDPPARERTFELLGDWLQGVRASA